MVHPADRAVRRQLLYATCPQAGSFCAMAWAMRDSRQIRTFGCVAVSLNAAASFAAI